MYKLRLLKSVKTNRLSKLRFSYSGFKSSSLQYAITPFNMPSMSPTMTEGSVTKWLKKEGDSFSQGEVLLEIETDKAQIEVEAAEDGILAKILKENKDGKVSVGQPIAILAEEGDDLTNLELPKELETQPETVVESDSKPVISSNQTNKESKGSHEIKKFSNSPAVAKLFSNYLIPKDSVIEGTGPKGRLLKGDVLKFIKTNSIEKRKQDEFVPIASNNSPSSQSNNLQTNTSYSTTESSYEVPTSYLSLAIDTSNLVTLQAKLSKSNIKVELEDLVILACSKAIANTPEINVKFNPESKDNIQQLTKVNLVVSKINGYKEQYSLIENSDKINVSNFSKISDCPLSESLDTLYLNDAFKNSSFSIYNLSKSGVQSVKPVINTNQTCSLAIGATQQKHSNQPKPTNFTNEDVFSFLINAPQKPNVQLAELPTIQQTQVPETKKLDILDYLTESSFSANKVESLENGAINQFTLSFDSRVVSKSTANQFLKKVQTLVQDSNLL